MVLILTDTKYSKKFAVFTFTGSVLCDIFITKGYKYITLGVNEMKTVFLRLIIALIWMIVSGYQFIQGTVTWGLFSLLITFIFVYSGLKEKRRINHD